MLYGWSAFYAAVTFTVLLAVWKADTRGIGIALFLSVLVTTALDTIVPPEGSAGIKVVVESGLMLVVMMHLFLAPRVAGFVLPLNLLSIIISMSFATNQDLSALGKYEIAVNIVLLFECAVVLIARLHDVLVGVFSSSSDGRDDPRRRSAFGRMGPPLAPGVAVAPDREEA